MSQLNFQYWALDRAGAESRGTLRAMDERDAYRRLAATGLTPTRLRVRREGGRSKVRGRRVKPGDIANFTYQFSVLLEARLPVVDCLRSIAEQEQNERLRAISLAMASSVQAGSTITQAMAPYERVFGTVYLETMRAAEQSGSTITVLAHLAEDVEEGLELRRALKGAVIYPVIVVVALVSAVMFLVTFVIPRFGEMFEKRGVDLPLLTRGMIAFGESVTGYWWVYLGVIGGGIAILRSMWSSAKGRRSIDRFLHRIPHVRGVLCGLGVSRFAGVFGISLSAGLGLIDGLEMGGRASGRPLLEKDAKTLVDRVRQGGRLGESLRSCDYLPPFAKQLIRAGEESGDLPRMCKIIAKYYTRETMHLAKSTATVLEPVLIAGLTIVVLIVALAVFLPMWDMVTIME